MHNILEIIWVASAVALVFWVMHYWVAGYLASTDMFHDVGTALAGFFPGGN